jgi:polyisoprenoid-binding protein YceI
MKFASGVALVCLLLAGCNDKVTPKGASAKSAESKDTKVSSEDTSTADAETTTATTSGTATTPSTTDSTAPKSAGPVIPSPTGAESNNTAGLVTAVKLTPENTKIQFVGKHVGPQPDRVCTFEKFSGEATLTDDGKSLKSVTADIETASLKSFDPKLTNHLNSPDFLDTRTHPNITFKSTRISKDEAGKTQIAGDLTLHGVTKPITFPAEVTIEGNDLSLKAQFTIDRTEYGMDQMLEGVQKPVDITVTVGKANDSKVAAE